jgi:hypothetical protein
VASIVHRASKGESNGIKGVGKNDACFLFRSMDRILVTWGV